MTDATDWIAADWGMSHLRVWLMEAGGRMLDSRASTLDMGALDPAGFEPALAGLLADVAPDRCLPVIACGMVGARQGWAEAPYATAPCPPPSLVQATRLQTDRFDLHILPGIMQTQPPDVMRGAETRIAGFLARTPGFDGVCCLPGPHTKWVQISAGEVIGFRSFMTGELFDLLKGHSVLRHSITGADWDAEAFAKAVSDTLSRPADLAARLFAIRAEDLVSPLHPGVAAARLSGLLIGAELAAAKPYWLGQEIAFIGTGGVARAYATALAAQGLSAHVADAEACTLRGLIAAYTQHKAPAA